MEGEKFASKISKNIAKQNCLKHVQLAENIRDCISIDLKQKRRKLDRKIFDSRSAGKKEISFLALEKNRERWLNFLVNINILHNNNKLYIINLCK